MGKRRISDRKDRRGNVGRGPKPGGNPPLPGLEGEVESGGSLDQGMWSALPMIPSMLRKRRAFRSRRRLTPSQIRKLLLSYRISLKELSEQATT